jgi:phospholipid/cholesterol/gamma-HCH transport system substrate-binding protein
VAKGILDVLSETATPVADNVQTTLRKFNVILDNLTKNSQQLDSIFRKFQATPVLLNATLISANSKIEELSGSFKQVADNLNGSLVELKPAMANFKVLSDSLNKLELNKTVKNSNVNTKQNQCYFRQSGKWQQYDEQIAMTEDSLYVNLNKLLLSLDTLAQHFDDNPNHFWHLWVRAKRRLIATEERKKKQKRLLKKRNSSPKVY